jgi:hypothetical protein
VKKQATVVFGGLTLVLAILACSYGSSTNMEATVEALGVKVEATVTAAASVAEITRVAPQTAEAEATTTFRSFEATQSRDDALGAEARQATATAAVPVLAELRTYGVNTSKGKVAWLHPPATVEVEGYQQFDFVNEYMNILAEDFVISADITWNTQYGTSGCGFMLRSDGDRNKPNQYMVVATRGGSGHVLLFTLVDGEPANGYDIYARSVDRSFQWQNDTTNKLAVVGRGNLFSIYTNGTLLGEIDVTQPPSRPALPSPPQPPGDQSDQAAMQKYQDDLEAHQELVTEMQSNYLSRLNTYDGEVPLFEKGFVAMTALSESGRTECQFDNAWLWLLQN